MRKFLKEALHYAKLCYLWITRILLAPNRFNVPLVKRLWFGACRGFTGDQIALYGLNRQNSKDYLSEFDWYRSRRINEPFDSMLNNKVVCNEVLQQYVAVPKIFFVKNKGRIVSYEIPERRCSIEEVMGAIVNGPAMFLKPIGSGRGQGVHRLEWLEDVFLLDTLPIPAADLKTKLAKDDGWFLSESIEQHEELADIFPRTSNTLRVITMREPEDGSIHVFFAVLRIGTADTVPVDNGSRGGLVAHVDLLTGELSEARTLWSHDSFDKHPHSLADIKGRLVPNWEQTVACVLEMAERLPFMQFIAWDVLVGAEKPWIIEANTSSGVNIIQLWGPQRENELGEFYRAHGVRV